MVEEALEAEVPEEVQVQVEAPVVEVLEAEGLGAPPGKALLDKALLWRKWRLQTLSHHA